MTFDANTPKNPGDRAFGHGDQVTLELAEIQTGEADLSKGLFVDFDGTGGLVRTGTEADGYTGSYDAVLKHSAEVGDKVTVHLRGLVRVAEDASSSDWPVVGTADGDQVISLR